MSYRTSMWSPFVASGIWRSQGDQLFEENKRMILKAAPGSEIWKIVGEDADLIEDRS